MFPDDNIDDKNFNDLIFMSSIFKKQSIINTIEYSTQFAEMSQEPIITHGMALCTDILFKVKL